MSELLQNKFTPKIVAFLCNWCSYAGADSAAKAQKKLSVDLRIVRVMCTGRIDPQFILWAFRNGADAVLILGCHPGDCHYKEGNFNALRRYHILKEAIKHFGIEKERIKIDWVSANEGDRFVKIVSEFEQVLRKLGPLKLNINSWGSQK